MGKIRIFSLLIFMSFNYQSSASDNSTEDSLLVAAINRSDKAAIDSLRNIDPRLGFIKNDIIEDSLSIIDLNKLIDNISDWNINEEHKIDVSIPLLRLLSKVKPEVVNIPEKLQEKTLIKDITAWTFPALVGSIFSLLMFSLLLRLKNRRMTNDELDKRIRSIVRDTNEQLRLGENDTILSRLSKLESRIKELENLIKKRNIDVAKNEEVRHVSYTNDADQSQILYANNVFENTFKFDKTKPNKEGTLYFKLETKEDKGRFVIIDDYDIQCHLVDYAHAIIESTCQELNSTSNFKNGIKIIEPGEIKKSDSGWYVTKKIKIKYE